MTSPQLDQYEHPFGWAISPRPLRSYSFDEFAHARAQGSRVLKIFAKERVA
jgi:hypothetical protein